MILVVLSVLAVYVHTCALSFAQAPEAAGPEQAEDDYDYCIKQALAADKPLEEAPRWHLSCKPQGKDMS